MTEMRRLMTQLGLTVNEARLRPVPLPRSKTPAEPTIPRHWRFRRCSLRSNDSEGFSMRSISRLLRGFSTCCLRFKNGVARPPQQGSLPTVTTGSRSRGLCVRWECPASGLHRIFVLP